MASKQKSKQKALTKKMKKTKVPPIVSDGMDVATDNDLDKLSELLKKHNVIVVLIHADWCGHCQTFKPLWEDYKKIPGRNVPMVSVNEKMLAKTPFKDAKIDGFPSSLVYSGKDGSFGSFKNDKGEDSNSIPNIRDKNVMMKILKAKPSMLQRVNNNSDADADADADPTESARATPEAEALLETSGKKEMRNKDKPMIKILASIPPNTNSDTIPERRVAMGGMRMRMRMRTRRRKNKNKGRK